MHSTDGAEVIVGVKLEVERTKSGSVFVANAGDGGGNGHDRMDVDGATSTSTHTTTTDRSTPSLKGRADWISVSLTLPGVRDDDTANVALEETLKEGLAASVHGPSSTTSPSSSPKQSYSLQNLLPINTRFHWRIYIDIVVISSGSSGSGASAGGGGGGTDYSPLPLISFGIYLALRDTRVPLLKSTGEEDPMFEDDWERAVELYPRDIQSTTTAGTISDSHSSLQPSILYPPLTLLLCAIDPPPSHSPVQSSATTSTEPESQSTILLDPTRTELAVADAIIAVSLGILSSPSTDTPSTQSPTSKPKLSLSITSLRTLDPLSRDTFPGFPADVADPSSAIPSLSHHDPPTKATITTTPSKSKPSSTSATPNAKANVDDHQAGGIWRPKVGGVRRGLFGQIAGFLAGSDGDVDGGGRNVIEDIVEKLDGFLSAERDRDRDLVSG